MSRLSGTRSRRRRQAASIAALGVCTGLVLSGAPVAAQAEEPVGDLAMVLGSVFCDDDGDGRRGASEPGLGGVRVVEDSGWQVDSDRHGRWHLHRVEPGIHLLKVDEATLPPGATLPGGPRHLLRSEAGLPEPVFVPVACAYEVVRPDGVVGPDDAGEAPKKRPGKVLPLVTVAGRVDRAQAVVDGRPLPVLEGRLRVLQPEPGGDGGINIPWAPGPLQEPLVLGLIGHAEAADGADASWRLVVTRVGAEGERTIRELFGQGRPPREVSWDGTEPAGTASLLDAGGLYRARLVVADGAGQRLTTAPVTFGISYRDSAGPIAHRVLRGNNFTDRGNVTAELRRAFQRLRKTVKRNPGSRVLIEVHSDDQALPEISLARSRKSAFLAAGLAAKILRIDASRISALGYGGSRPLRPNLSDKDRRFNRRVEVTVLPRERPDSLLPVPAYRPRARVLVAGLDAVIEDDDTWVRSVVRPPSNALSLSVTDHVGAELEVMVDLSTLPPLAEEARAEADPLRRFGGEPLREALGDPVVGSRDPRKTVTAGDLSVRLPPPGAEVDALRLFVGGRSDPRNRVRINGHVAEVDPDGRFGEVVPLGVGTRTIEVVAEDDTGHVATVKRTVEVSDMSFFVLALADGAVGELDAHLRGPGETTSIDVGPVQLHGRGAVVFRGRISGTVLADHLELVARVDSAKRPQGQPFHEQVIDPARDYPVFGDATLATRPGEARGPFYVLVRADDSTLALGNVRTGLEGVELLRYDRAVYGAMLDFDRAFANGWDTRVKGFVTDDVKRLQRGHDEIRATGGSLYYLSSQDVVEGSERLTVVVRERDTRLELDRRPLARDADYRIDYLDGRILLKEPLSAVADARGGLAPFQPLTGRQILPGHEVWLVIDYETRSGADGATLAGGAHASQKLFDLIEVGGGYVREERAGDADYELFGGHVAVELGAATRVVAEIAGSRGVDGGTQLSDDGGLSFEELDRSGGRNDGFALKLGLDSHVGELVGLGKDLDLRVRGWWHLEESGFHAQGHAQDAGSERFGGEAVYRPTRDDRVSLRFDGTTTLVEDDRFTTGFRAVKRFRYTARYERLLGPITLQADAAFGQHRDDALGKVFDTGGVAVGASWRILPELTAHVSQASTLGGDDELLGPSLAARQTTRFGVDWQLLDDLAVTVGHAVRWDGDNAMRVGLRTKVDERSSAYVEERLLLSGSGDAREHATVMGAETELDGGGRAWSEFRLEDGVSGPTNQAILGVGKRFQLVDGVVLSGAYERAQTFGGVEGSRSRDVGSVGLEVTALDWLKLGGRYELRWDQGGDRELVQAVMRTGVTATPLDGLTALAAFHYTLTQNLTTRDVEREAMEMTFGAIYRPHPVDWLTVAGRYSRIYRRRLAHAQGLFGDTLKLAERVTTDLASASAIFEIPFGFRVTEKVTLRHRDAFELPSDTETLVDLLWATRVGWHGLVDGLDISAEYRLWWEPGPGALHHGALAEVGYTLFGYARLAVGYDFTDIPRELDADATPGRGGVYARVTGTY